MKYFDKTFWSMCARFAVIIVAAIVMIMSVRIYEVVHVSPAPSDLTASSH